MRIRMLKDYLAYRAGEIVEMEPGLAQALISKQMAMQDKSIEPKETKNKRGKSPLKISEA